MELRFSFSRIVLIRVPVMRFRVPGLAVGFRIRASESRSISFCSTRVPLNLDLAILTRRRDSPHRRRRLGEYRRPYRGESRLDSRKVCAAQMHPSDRSSIASTAPGLVTGGGDSAIPCIVVQPRLPTAYSSSWRTSLHTKNSHLQVLSERENVDVSRQHAAHLAKRTKR